MAGLCAVNMQYAKSFSQKIVEAEEGRWITTKSGNRIFLANRQTDKFMSEKVVRQALQNLPKEDIALISNIKILPYKEKDSPHGYFYVKDSSIELFVPDNITIYGRAMAEDDFISTLYHEVGHAVGIKKISISQIKEFKKIRDENLAYKVSSLATINFDEDFAETYANYHKGLLQAQEIKRYKFMVKHFKKIK